ncbi:hypothetical protein ACVLB3_001050 [Pseudarthrobacter sp. PvP022]
MLRKKLANARSTGDAPRSATLATVLGRAKTRRAPRLMDSVAAMSTSIGNGRPRLSSLTADITATAASSQMARPGIQRTCKTPLRSSTVPLAPSIGISVILSPRDRVSRPERHYWTGNRAGGQNRKEIVLMPASSTSVVTDTAE